MKYKDAVIETKTEIIDGKKVEVQVIPQGVSGLNGKFVQSSVFEEDEDFESKTIPKDSSLQKEYSEYLDEGIEPDTDEVRAIKEEIEKEYIENILDPLELEDVD